MPDLERELFESAMSGETPEQNITEQQPVETEQPVATEGERTRDDKGRFAPKQETKPKEAEPQPIEQPEQVVEQPQAQQPAQKTVPSFRLKEESDAKREAISRAELAEKRANELEQTVQNLQRQFFAFQQQASQPQTEPQKVDLFENPEHWAQHQQRGVQSLLQQQSLQFSEQLARIKYGDELYDAADRAAQAVMMSGHVDPNLAAVGRSQNPGVSLVEWFKRKQTLDRLGGMDVDKFIEQEIEKRAADPQFQNSILERARAQAKPNTGPANPINNPPSLNRQTSAASNNPADDDESDGALLKSALRR